MNLNYNPWKIKFSSSSSSSVGRLLCLLWYSVQIKHVEDADILGVCWIILLFP